MSSAKPYISKKLRLMVENRAKNRCEYCQCRSDCATESFEIEHIIPPNKGGKSNDGNLALACRGCNSRKSDKITGIDTLTGKVVPLYNPRTESWKHHFAWDDNFLQVIGLTLTGRATVVTLQLNRKGVMNLRALMKKGAIHPPADML
jgi:HNH endonuclease